MFINDCVKCFKNSPFLVGAQNCANKENGAFTEPYRESGFSLTPRINITPKDIREIQLAKSAIRAAFETLLEESGTKYSDIETLYLSGSFGQAINVEKAAAIGLIPKELAGRTLASGNTSLLGACKLAWGETTEDRCRIAAQRIKVLELADDPRFAKLYMSHMGL